jgi:uncharacterized membrane protein
MIFQTKRGGYTMRMSPIQQRIAGYILFTTGLAGCVTGMIIATVIHYAEIKTSQIPTDTFTSIVWIYFVVTAACIFSGLVLIQNGKEREGRW